MSKIMQHAQDWLEYYGYELGYNMKLMPKMEHLKIVTIHKIPVWKYMGYKTEKGFYSTTGKIKSNMEGTI